MSKKLEVKKRESLKRYWWEVCKIKKLWGKERMREKCRRGQDFTKESGGLCFVV